MPPRASWKGCLKISLVNVQVRLYNATTTANRITLNQVHKNCNQRLKFPAQCPVHGTVERDDISKAYEFEPDKYVIIEQSDIERIKLEGDKTITVDTFVDAESVNPMYLDAAYYMGPDGPVSEEAFTVVRDALKQSGKVGLGRVTMLGRERLLVVAPEGRGLRMTTLRCCDEVRTSDGYFDDVPDRQINPDHLSLATRLIESMAGEFNPETFKDRYQEQLLEVIKAKVAGQEPVLIQEQEAAKNFSFMDALKLSVGQTPAAPAAPAAAAKAKEAPAKAGRKPAAKSVTAGTAAKKRKQA